MSCGDHRRQREASARPALDARSDVERRAVAVREAEALLAVLEGAPVARDLGFPETDAVILDEHREAVRLRDHAYGDGSPARARRDAVFDRVLDERLEEEHGHE